MGCDFATCIYGATPSAIKMLKVFAYSLGRHTDSTLLIYHEPELVGELEEIRILNPNVEFLDLDVSWNRGSHQPAQKVSWWYRIINRSYSKLILCDFDMLVLNDPSIAFDRHEGDILYTMKDDLLARYRLNTGVVFVRNSVKSWDFFQSWNDMVFDILNCEDHKVAESFVEQYGAVDQAAFSILAKEQGNITLSPVSASRYNHHKDWSIVPEDCRLIHYKSGWSEVLLHGDDFKAALKHAGWDKIPDALTWKPCFDLWRKEYNELKQLERNQNG